jgi:hypothetical protein
MFAVVNAVLLKPLPFKDADRLMLVRLLAPDLQAGPGVYREVVWSYPKYRTFLDVQHSFEDAALFGGRDYSLSGDGDPERVRGEVVTDRFPTILGIAPILGRTFTYDEANRAGAQPVVMIGHGLWTRRYTILAKRRNDVPEAEAMAAVGVNGGQVDAQYRQDGASQWLPVCFSPRARFCPTLTSSSEPRLHLECRASPVPPASPESAQA